MKEGLDKDSLFCYSRTMEFKITDENLLEWLDYLSQEAYHADGLEWYDMAVPTERIAELRDYLEKKHADCKAPTN